MKRKEKKPNRPCGMSAKPDVLTDEPRTLSDSLRLPSLPEGEA